MHFIAPSFPMQSGPYLLDGRKVCDLSFTDADGNDVRITLPFFIGLVPPGDDDSEMEIAA